MEVVVVVAVLLIAAGLVRRFWAQIIAFVVLSGIAAIAAAVYVVVQKMHAMAQ